VSIHANDLAPSKGATHARKRLARGNSAGGGTYAGKGLKGQKSRSGSKIRLGFEGGQLPLIRRLHTLRGFNNKWRIAYQPVNTGTLQERFEDGAEVTPETLRVAGVLRNLNEPVKILARGDLTRPLNVYTHKVSAAARSRIEAAGGTVTLIGDDGEEAAAETAAED
tara:strand:- start:55 stop:552 length:498 start_codon:yes stop_codon:yes gene_type:complete